MHKTLILILALVFYSFALPAIAIRDFKGVGISAEEAAIVSSKLQTEFVHSRRFEVLERSAIEEITREMEFNASGICDDANCLVELGKMLSVEKLIVGSVGKLEGSYTLTMRLLDIETGTIENSYSSDRVATVGALYDSLIPQAVHFFIQKFDFQKHQLKEAGKIGGITPKLNLYQRDVLLAGAGNFIEITPLIETVQDASPGKRLTYTLGNGRPKAISSFEYSSEEELQWYRNHHRFRKRVELVEGQESRFFPSAKNRFVLQVPTGDTVLPLVVTLECESGATVSDTTIIVPRQISGGEVTVRALAELITVNSVSKLSVVAENDPITKEYLNLHISYDPITFDHYTKVMADVSGYRSGWREKTPADISAFNGKEKRERVREYNDSLQRLETGISWYNAILFCNEKSKAEGLDTIYSYTKIKGAPGSPKCRLVEVKELPGEGYRLPKLDEARMVMRCGTELYDNNLGLEITGYEWCSEKGKVYSPVGDKKKFPPHTYKLQGKSSAKRGIVPAFRTVRAVID